MRKYIIGGTALILAVVMMIYSAPEVSAQRGAPAGAVQAADFTLTDLDGKPVKLSDYKGKVVILDFWATWCPPCVKEIPHFNDLHRDYAKKGLVVLGVSVDQGGLAAVQKFKKKTAIDYRVVLSQEPTYNLYQSYLPKDERGGIPFTFVIDKKGIIREHFVGYREKAVFEKVVKELL
jgi:peroxiredoxin